VISQEPAFSAKPSATARFAAATTIKQATIMRTRTRIHPYVLPEISNRLAAYCGAKGLTESAAVEAALSAYLDGGERDNDLILRRLDRLTRDSARQRRDQEVLLEAFAMFVRHWFKYVPERSQAEDLAAQRLALKRFDEFVHWTSLALARGSRLASDVLKDEAPPEQPSPKVGQPPHGNPR